MHGGLEERRGIPGAAGAQAGVGESEAPGDGAGEGVELEFPEIHAGDAGGERDVGSDDGEQAAEEDGDGAVAGEGGFDPGEFGLADEDVASVVVDEASAAGGAGEVGGG